MGCSKLGIGLRDAEALGVEGFRGLGFRVLGLGQNYNHSKPCEGSAILVSPEATFLKGCPEQPRPLAGSWK